MQVGVASREARGGDSNELLFAAVSSLEGGEIIDANEQLASVARESERFAHSWQQGKQDFFLDKNYICMIYEPTICFFLQKIKINNFSG